MIFYHAGEYLRNELPVSPAALHFRYGAGFFETLLHNGRMLCHLEAHLERLFGSLEAFGLPYAKAPFEEIVDELRRRNGLSDKTARVNIFYPVEAEDRKARPLITAIECVPDTERIYFLALYPLHHVSYLCRHKSMNYLHYQLARRHAKAREADDAVLTDPSGLVLETSSAALLFSSDGKTFVAPRSDFSLPSIALARASRILPVREREIRVDDLPGFRHAYVLNSLVGMRPVRRIGDHLYEADPASCELASMQIL